MKALGTDAGTGISFSSASSGYVSVDRFGNQSAGYVFRTKDGGKTWQPQLIAPDSVEVRDEHATGFAISPFTDDAGFFATTTGGQAGDKSKLTLDVAKKKSSKAQKKVKVLGKLSPPEGGEQIVVSSRKSADSNWKNDTLTAGLQRQVHGEVQGQEEQGALRRGPVERRRQPRRNRYQGAHADALGRRSHLFDITRGRAGLGSARATEERFS